MGDWQRSADSRAKAQMSGPGQQRRGFASGVGDDLGWIEVDGAGIAHQHLSVDDGVAYVGSAGRVQPASNRVRAGCEVGPIEAHDDQIGSFARLDRADVSLQAEGASAFAGCHPDRIARGQRARPLPDRLQHGREAHLLEHVEAVVAGRPVGAQRHGDPASA